MGFVLHFYGWAGLLARADIWSMLAVKLWLNLICYRATGKEMW